MQIGVHIMMDANHRSVEVQQFHPLPFTQAFVRLYAVARNVRCNASATKPGPMGTRSIGLVGILGGLVVGQGGVLDFLADFRGGEGLGMNAWSHGLKLMRCAGTGGTISVANRQSTRQARFWLVTGPYCDEEYDHAKLNI